jgi:hypothetical protein
MVNFWYPSVMGLQNTGLDALGSNGIGASATGNVPAYTAAQLGMDLYSLGNVAVNADVLMAQGQPQYGYQDVPQQNIGGAQYGGPNKFAGNIAQTGGTKPNIMTLNDAMNWMQTLDPGKMTGMNNALFAAGYYPTQDYGKTPNPPAGGGQVFDDHAQYAARSLFMDVIRYNTANPNNQKSMNEILQDRIDKKTGQSMIDTATSQTPGKVFQVTTDDPATLRATVVRTAQAILGRNVTDDESNALVNMMTKAEVTPQMAAINASQTAQTGPDVVLQQAQVDAQARLAEQVKAQNPDEAGAYAQLNYTNMLTNMLGGSAPGGQASA